MSIKKYSFKETSEELIISTKITVSKETFKKTLEINDNPPEPTEALKKLMRKENK